MAEDDNAQTPPAGQPAGVAGMAPAYAASPPRRGAGRAVIGAALLAFVLGGGAVGYAVWQGLVPVRPAAPAPLAAPATPAASLAPAKADPAAMAAHQSELETRMAALEQRLDAVNAQADAASGNAARAEALLVAFAARRAIDRGTALGYLEDQLRLRFGNAQPNAVATVIDASHTPVTLDQLVAGLDSLGPALTRTPADASAWTKIKRQIASLFVIRHESTPSPAPLATLQRARLLLGSGRVSEAMAAIQRLPGSPGASDWFTAARRYDDTQRALDVLETAAMLDTRSPRDGAGRTGDQPAAASPPA
jgi:hypothetical protein